MDTLLKRSLKQQHAAAKNVLAYREQERKKDAMALAELIYDVFKEKKRKENVIIENGQNNAQQLSQN